MKLVGADLDWVDDNEEWALLAASKAQADYASVVAALRRVFLQAI